MEFGGCYSPMAMTVLPDLVNPGTPVEAEWGNEVIAALQALVVQLNAITPIGSMLPYGGDTSPSSYWLLARGGSVSRTTYSALYAVYADKFGVGRPAPPAGEFWLPDMRGVVPAGANPGGSYAATVGARDGSADQAVPIHSHTTPNHYHDLNNHSHRVNGGTSHDGDHQHTPGTTGNFMTATINPSGVVGSGGAQLAQVVFDTVTGVAGGHSHLMNFDTWGPNIGTTGWASALGTDNTGVSGALKNLQPSVAVNYIVRAL